MLSNKMMMMVSVGSIVLLICAMVYVSNRVGDPAIHDQGTCESTTDNKTVMAAFNAGTLKDGTSCDVWDGTHCRKGTTTGAMCNASPSRPLQVMLALTAIAVVVAIFYAYKFFTEK
jgi:hypothetical protein